MKDVKLELKDWETFQEKIVKVYGDPTIMVPIEKDLYPNRHAFFFSESRVAILNSTLYTYDECPRPEINDDCTHLIFASPDPPVVYVDLHRLTKDEVKRIMRQIKIELSK